MENKLRELRESKGWSYDQAAKHSGVGASLIHRLEKGRTPSPSLHSVAALATAYGVSLGYLAGTEDSSVTAVIAHTLKELGINSTQLSPSRVNCIRQAMELIKPMLLE